MGDPARGELVAYNLCGRWLFACVSGLYQEIDAVEEWLGSRYTAVDFGGEGAVSGVGAKPEGNQITNKEACFVGRQTVCAPKARK